jgi:hypothetical protein
VLIAKWTSFSWIVMVDVDEHFGPGSGAGRIVCSRSAKMVSILFLIFLLATNSSEKPLRLTKKSKGTQGMGARTSADQR